MIKRSDIRLIVRKDEKKEGKNIGLSQAILERALT